MSQEGGTHFNIKKPPGRHRLREKQPSWGLGPRKERKDGCREMTNRKLERKKQYWSRARSDNDN